MNYPLISEYVEAIKAAEDNFGELTNLRPVLGDDGQPIMTSGNFAVVFKMKDEKSGKLFAVKCFTKEQEGRDDAYRQIMEELKKVDSPYLISIQYIDKELFVHTDQTPETEFPVLLMDWVEGKPLDKYLRENISSKFIIETLLDNFYQLSEWLILQPFAHGDLKPDNILVREDASLVLVDYDGMYVPSMKGQKSHEIGSPDFCHPLRTEESFDEHIDDFSILSILLSLCIVFDNKNYLEKYGAEDRLLFSKKDYIDIHKSFVFKSIPPIIEISTNYKSLFEKACVNLDFHLGKKLLTPVNNLIIAIRQQDKETNDAIRELAHLGIWSRIKENKMDVQNLPNEHTQQPAFNNTTQRDSLERKKREKTTKWQSALLLHILTMLYPILLFTNEHNNDSIWMVMGWGFGIGLIAWSFAYFDYIKRDGSFGNCFLALLLFPITLYYGIYRIICMCINMLKEWRV